MNPDLQNNNPQVTPGTGVSSPDIQVQPQAVVSTEQEEINATAPQAAIDPASTAAPTTPTVTAGQIYEEQVKAKTLGEEVLPNIRSGEGINLIPTLTKEEIATETKKISFNYFGAFSILFLVLFSIAIIGFNILTKSMLNREKRQLIALEDDLKSQSDIINANNSIIERVDLYQDVQSSTFSPKNVLLYWNELTAGYGELGKVELVSGLNFKVDGKAKNLSDVSQLWHLLSIDDRALNTNLSSVGKTEKEATYKFEGDLSFDYFIAENSKGIGDSDSTTESDTSNN